MFDFLNDDKILRERANIEAKGDFQEEKKILEKLRQDKRTRDEEERLQRSAESKRRYDERMKKKAEEERIIQAQKNQEEEKKKARIRERELERKREELRETQRRLELDLQEAEAATPIGAAEFPGNPHDPNKQPGRSVLKKSKSGPSARQSSTGAIPKYTPAVPPTKQRSQSSENPHWKQKTTSNP